MSAEDYGYASYDEMLNHAEHHGGGIDMDANAVEWVVSELSALRAERDTLTKRVAELEAHAATLTPRKCGDCNPLAPDTLTDDERAFGVNAWVYCRQHCKPHLTGWCGVGNSEKFGLGITGQENASQAYDKAKIFAK